MRAITSIVLFLVAFNAGAGALQASGAAADLGINAETGDPDAVSSLGDNPDEIELGTSRGGTLFGSRIALVRQAQAIFYGFAPGFQMLRIFLPNVFVDFLSSIASFLATAAVLSYARGYDL